MFQVTEEEVSHILADYGLLQRLTGTEELLRYNYQRNDPASKEVRLIVKAAMEGHEPVVVKFKYETDISQEIIEAQCAFSEHLLSRGVPAAHYYRAKGNYVGVYQLCGQEIWVTVEDFHEGEIKVVNPEIAGKIGGLLARMHNISEADDCHVAYEVLFDPLARNDLFSFERLMALRSSLPAEQSGYFDRIEAAYEAQMKALSPMRKMKRYAVQGDVSDCNLFLMESGEVGVFDFNNCGDNTLFGDAIMQAVFVARLMDYDRELSDEYSGEMLASFLKGYDAVRPFTEEERNMLPHLYAVISGLWRDDAMKRAVEKQDWARTEKLLCAIEREIARGL